jgi:hypothetical protein
VRNPRAMRSKLFGTPEYNGNDFSVRVRPRFRENVSVIYTHHGTELSLDGERIGGRWEGVQVLIPSDLEAEKVTTLVSHLEAAFQALGLGYVIVRLAEVEHISDADRQAAMAELREMGYEMELSADRKRAQVKAIPGIPPRNRETLRIQAPRMMSLIQDVRGTRQRYQTLAKSKEF